MDCRYVEMIFMPSGYPILKRYNGTSWEDLNIPSVGQNLVYNFESAEFV